MEKHPEQEAEEHNQNNDSQENGQEGEQNDQYEELPTNMQKKNQQREDVPSGKPVFKNALEEKLWNIRMKSEEGRKRNRQEVGEEHKRVVGLPPGLTVAEPTQRQVSAREWREREERILKEAEERGEDPEIYRNRSRTAEQLDRADKKKKAKTGVFGWEVFSPEAQYYTQKRKVKQLRGTDEEYEKQKAETPDFYREADNVNFVNAPKLPKQNVDRMVDDLKASIAKRKEVSRRRVFREEGVDYINERNRAFNQRVGKAYDAYTAEIRANLERGTAL